MKVGDYVRTKDGIIDKVIIDYNGHCADPKCNCKHVSCVYNYYDEDTIVKSSPNIIDLIEFGDYVNGKQVIDFMLENGKRKEIIVDADIWGFDIDEIKSIVTHEQFESMEYKL